MWYTIDSAIDMLGISRDMMLGFINNGQVPFIKNGTRYLVNPAQVNEYMQLIACQYMKDVQAGIKADMSLSKKKVMKPTTARRICRYIYGEIGRGAGYNKNSYGNKLTFR